VRRTFTSRSKDSRVVANVHTSIMAEQNDTRMVSDKTGADRQLEIFEAHVRILGDGLRALSLVRSYYSLRMLANRESSVDWSTWYCSLIYLSFSH
jgi:hypothetical protein